MSITTEVTVEVINTWVSKEVEDLDINDVFQEKGSLTYVSNPTIQEVFYEEVVLQTGQLQTLDFRGLSQLMFTEFVGKAFTFLDTLSIINIDASGTLQIVVTGTNGMTAPFGNPAVPIPIGPRGVFHYSTVSGIDVSTDSIIDLRNDDTVPVSYQLFAAGSI